MSRRALVIFLAAFVGFAIAMYPPFHAAAESRYLFFGPPTRTDGIDAYLDQSWHYDDVSLDWDGKADTTVYSRAWGKSWDWDPTVLAQGELSQEVDYEGCRNVVWLDIYDIETNTWQASIGYVHTNDPQFTGRINYQFSYFEVYNSQAPVSIMTEGDTCTWSGLHVHETTYRFGGAAPHKGINTAAYGDPAPPNPPPPPPPPPYNFRNNNGDYWTRDFWW